jgi:hypothetical protein
MKKLALLGLLIITCFNNYAQHKTQDIFTEENIVWYGLDFTKAKFIGKVEQVKNFEQVSSIDIINKYIPAWNELVVMEPDNFKLESTFRKKTIHYDLNPVAARNGKIAEDNIIAINSNTITKEELQDMVSAYEGSNKQEGLGLVFIIESFNKPQSMASAWVVFFDINTKKILLSEYCKGEPAGFGVRNYWAGAIKKIMTDIRNNKYKNWKKLYSNSSDQNSTVTTIK